MNKKPLYLFVCVENSCRSQMAQGLFNAMAVEAQAESAGTFIEVRDLLERKIQQLLKV